MITSRCCHSPSFVTVFTAQLGWVFGHMVVDIPTVSFCHSDPFVTLPLCYSPSLPTHILHLFHSILCHPECSLWPFSPSEVRCWVPGWVTRGRRRPKSKLRNLKESNSWLLLYPLIQQPHTEAPTC